MWVPMGAYGGLCGLLGTDEDLWGPIDPHKSMAAYWSPQERKTRHKCPWVPMAPHKPP